MAFFAVIFLALFNAFVQYSSGHVVSRISENQVRDGINENILLTRSARETTDGSSRRNKITDKRSKREKEVSEKENTKMQSIPKVVMSHTGTYGHKIKTKVVQDAKILFNNQPATFHRSKGYKPFRKVRHNKLRKILGRSGKTFKRHETLHKMPLVEESPVKKESLHGQSSAVNLPHEDHIPIVGHNSKAKLSSGKLTPIDSVEPLDMLEPMSFISVEENESLKKQSTDEVQENARKRSESTIKYSYGPRYEHDPEENDRDPTDMKSRPMGAFGTYKPPKVFTNPFKDHNDNNDNENEEEEEDEEYFVKFNDENDADGLDVSGSGDESIDVSGSGDYDVGSA